MPFAGQSGRFEARCADQVYFIRRMKRDRFYPTGSAHVPPPWHVGRNPGCARRDSLAKRAGLSMRGLAVRGTVD